MRRKEREVWRVLEPCLQEGKKQDPGREAKQRLELEVSSIQKSYLPETRGARMLYRPCQDMATESYFCGPCEPQEVGED